MIKEIFRHAKQIADLHAVLTSPTGDYFRLKLLQDLRYGLTEDQLRVLRKKAGLKEQVRHIDKLVAFKLAEYNEKKKIYIRTNRGESALNTVREFQRQVGKSKDAEKIFKANLGPHSIQLFLSVYDHKKDILSSPISDMLKKPRKLEIKYTPSEIGRIAGNLHRTIEGVAAIDKLDDAGILTYEDDGYVHFHPIKARSFYHYLKNLYEILSKQNGKKRRKS